jgi:uncharacterized protein DUF5681
MPVFQKGASGNPAGNHKGSRHKSTLLAQKILEDDREAIINAVVAAAKNGESTAMRLCADGPEAWLRAARGEAPVSRYGGCQPTAACGTPGSTPLV